MSYTKPTFVDVPNPASPPVGAQAMDAATMNAMAQAIVDAQTAAAAANGGVADLGVVLLDSYAGADDDAKLTTALSSVAADTYKRTIQLKNRQYNFATVNRPAFGGMRISGPGGYSNADKGAAFQTCEVHLTGNGPWFHNNTADVFDVSLRQLAFKGGSSSSVLGNNDAAHSWWRLQMRDISASGLKSVLGSQTQALLMTGAFFDGFWEINNCYNTAFHLGGSDNRLFMNGGFLDSGTAFNSSAGQAHLWLDFCENTVVGGLYITCEGPWGGVIVDGPAAGSAGGNQGSVVLVGLQVEGRNQGASCYGAPIRVNGGIVRIRDCGVHFGMTSAATLARSPVDAGMIHQAGGQMMVSGCTYDRATGVAETVPFVYTASTGKSVVNGTFPMSRGGTWAGLPRFALKTGVTDNRVADATVTQVTV